MKEGLMGGNVIEKGEGIEGWMGENGENEGMGEVKEGLEGVKDGEGEGMGLEDVELNLGEGWIGRGV